MTERPRDYRSSRRVDVHYHAVFKTPSDAVECTVTQISEGGALFVTHKPVEIKTRGVFAMDIFSNEPEMLIEGEVIYRLKERENRGTLVYGARFISLDAGQKENIARVLRYSTVKGRYTHKPTNTEVE